MPTKTSANKRRRRMLSDEGSEPFESVGFRPVYSVNQSQSQPQVSSGAWRSLSLPAMLGRKNLVSAWWEDCPRNHSVKRRKACPSCRPLLDMENVLYLLSKEMMLVSHDGTITVVARHKELVDFVPDKSNDDESSAVKSIGSVSIGSAHTRNYAEPWMKFELRLEKPPKAGRQKKQMKEKAEALDGTSATRKTPNRHNMSEGQESDANQKSSSGLLKQSEDTSHVVGGMMWQQKTSDGIITRRRREATIFKSSRKARRRLQESSDEDDTSGDDEVLRHPTLARKICFDVDTSPDSSPTRRELNFDESDDSAGPPRKRNHSNSSSRSEGFQDSLSSAHAVEEVDNSVPKVTVQAVISTPSGNHTNTKRFVTPEGHNSNHTKIAHSTAELSGSESIATKGSNRMDSSTEGGQDNGPLSQQYTSSGQNMGILSMPGLSQSEHESASNSQIEDSSSTAGARPPDQGKMPNDPGWKLGSWKLLAAKNPVGTALHSLASLVLIKNKSSTDGASLWIPSIVAPAPANLNKQ